MVRPARHIRLFKPLAWLTWHDIVAPYQWTEETMAHPEVFTVPGWETVAILAATSTGALLGDHERATMEARFEESLDFFERVDESDPQVRFIKAQLGGTIHAYLDPGPDTPGFRRTAHLLDEALEWTRSIGARNFEAAPTESQAILHQFRAAQIGDDVGRPPIE